MSLTPAAVSFTAPKVPIAAPPKLTTPSTGAAAMYASPKPGSLDAVDVPVIDAVASATKHLGAVGSAPDATAAASILKAATKDLLVAHRGALDVGISPALDQQLMDAATGLTTLAVKAASSPTSAAFDIGPEIPAASKQAVDVLAVLADHVTRIDDQVASGVYL